MIWEDGAELSNAPRRIPLVVRLRLCFSSVLTVFGFVFCTFAISVACLIFSPGALWSDFWLMMDSVPMTGTSTGWSETNSTINEAPVVATHFEYRASGQLRKSVSYMTDKAIEAGQPVKIKVAAYDPNIAVIEGARTSPINSIYLLAFFIIPLLGLLGIYSRYRSGQTKIHLLKHGLEIDGVVVSCTRTNITVNEEVLYELIIEYLDPSGKKHQFDVRTTWEEELLDEPEETLLVHPKKYELAMPIDLLPDYVHLQKDGT
ncbi:MAG: hypothetical protein ACPGQS_15205, partial [Bradymonadia bacterium]